MMVASTDIHSLLFRSFALIPILAFGCVSHNADKSNIRNGGLIFYDLKTNRTLLPPIVTPLKYSPSPRLPLIGRPCSCHSLNCGCCAGMTIHQFNFDQHLCTNFTYDPSEFSIQMDVMMNENSLYTNMVSAKNPPPLCLPFPLPPPIQLPLNIEMCVKLFNIFTPGRNLHMCMDMQMKVQKAPVIVLHFDCMRMGQNGVALVKPDQNGGLEVNPEGENGENGENPEVDNPEVDTVPQTQVMQPDVEPPQTDYDIYDEVTEPLNVNNFSACPICGSSALSSCLLTFLQKVYKQSVYLEGNLLGSAITPGCTSLESIFAIMEIINPSCALLSNFEVMEALRTIGDTKKKFGLRNLATISYEIVDDNPMTLEEINRIYVERLGMISTLRFLEEGSCRTQTKQNILQFMQAVKPFNLTKSECLMMVNDPPSSALHIQLQIEDSEERLSEDQVNEMIRIAQQWLVASDEE